MRAEICEPQNTQAFDCFRKILKDLGATSSSHNWAIGVDHWQVKIGGELLDVYSDSWLVDIEGSAELVNEIVIRMQQT